MILYYITTLTTVTNTVFTHPDKQGQEERMTISRILVAL